MIGEATRFTPKEEHHNWGGGSYVHPTGYTMILVDIGKYRPEHILIMEKSIGRKLLPGEVVHHKNEIRSDNRLSNLELMTRGDHSKHHLSGKIVSEETKALLCKIREGTHHKEAHNQWMEHITKETVISAIGATRTFKEAANMLGITADTLRARRKHYKCHCVSY